MKYILFLLVIFFYLNVSFYATAQEGAVLNGIYNSVNGTNSEPVLYSNVNMNSFELLTTNLQVSKEDDLQKVVFAPLKLLDNQNLKISKIPVGFLRDSRLNISQKDGSTTFGIALGYDSSSPFTVNMGEAVKDEVNKLYPNRVGFPSLRPKRSDESDLDYKVYESAFYRSIDKLYAGIYESLLKNSFRASISYNSSLFSVIGGDPVDLDNNKLIDNYYTTESNVYSANLTYAFSILTAVSISGHYTRQRGGAEEGKKIVPYFGGSVSAATKLALLNRSYQDTPDYLSSLFIPVVLIGASFEYKKATENKDFAKDNITRAWVVTPFLDFKINPKNQFRIGIPIKNYRGLKDEVQFGPFLQWTLQIAKKES